MNLKFFILILKLTAIISSIFFIVPIIGDDSELSLVEFIPYLLSSLIGCLFGGLYAQRFPEYFLRHSFTAALIPSSILLFLIILTGLINAWFIDAACVALSFLFCSERVAQVKNTELGVESL